MEGRVSNLITKFISPVVPMLFSHVLTSGVMMVFPQIKGTNSARSTMDDRITERANFRIIASFYKNRPPGIRLHLGFELKSRGVIFVIAPIYGSINALGCVIHDGFKLTLVHSSIIVSLFPRVNSRNSDVFSTYPERPIVHLPRVPFGDFG